MGKEINAIFGAQTILIWTYVNKWSVVRPFRHFRIHTSEYEQEMLHQSSLTNTLHSYLVGLAAYTVKHVLNSHSKIDKTKISTPNGSLFLMKVKSIAECSTWSILQYI